MKNEVSFTFCIFFKGKLWPFNLLTAHVAFKQQTKRTFFRES